MEAMLLVPVVWLVLLAWLNTLLPTHWPRSPSHALSWSFTPGEGCLPRRA